MKESNFRKLSRAELLKLLIEQMTENEMLRGENAYLQEQIRDRRMDLEQSGSLAEAALRLNGVFRAADAAAEHYLENLRKASEEADQIVRQAREEAQRILESANRDKVLLTEGELLDWGKL